MSAVFAVHRLTLDVPHVASGTRPEEGSFDERYTLHFLPAYLHIVPSLVYLFAAPLQLNRRFRNSHLHIHRRVGRVALTAGLFSGVFALVFGTQFPWGGPLEAAAVAVFAVWFLLCLCLAFVAIRGGNVAAHRRWMIRAFAVGLGVGTVRIWLGLLMAAGVMSFETSFGLAFWLAWVPHAVVAELYLKARPDPIDQPAMDKLSRASG